MNVTKNGYYTSQYLDERRDKINPRHHYYHPSLDATEYNYIDQGNAGHIRHDRDGRHFEMEDEGEVPRSTGYDIGEAASLYSKGDVFSTTVGAESHLSRRDNDSDYLEQRITPAQLNVLQRKQNRHRYHPSTGGYEYTEQPEAEAAPKYDGYYIAQKKRFDDSPYKPKLYTHKTFRDVFADPDEHSGKYNPMEFVFHEEEEDKKLKKAFKTVQSKMGRPDYNDYDYYKTKEKEKSNPVSEVFVNNESDDDSDSMYEVDGEIYVRNPDAKGDKKKKLRVVWKKKLKNAKRELGRDYMESTERQRQLKRSRARKKKKETSGAKIEEISNEEPEIAQTEIAQSIGEKSVAQDDIVPSEPVVIEPEEKAPMNYGPRSDFNPFWNYILSWLVYETPETGVPHVNDSVKDADPVVAESIVSSKHTQPKSIAKPPSKTSHTSKRPKAGKQKTKTLQRIPKVNLKQIKSGYKGVISRWNEPAANFFSGDYQVSSIGNPSVLSNASSRRTIAPTIKADDTDSQEIVVELDEEDADDESYIHEELYFNPITKQLERSPPTSSSSLDVSVAPSISSSVGSRPGSFFAGMIDVSSGPRAIISNINSLIKNFKIMRIIFAPIDVIAEIFPNLQTVVTIVELGIFIWILYELSLLVDALCMMVKAFCAPMIALGRFMNRIV